MCYDAIPNSPLIPPAMTWLKKALHKSRRTELDQKVGLRVVAWWQQKSYSVSCMDAYGDRRFFFFLAISPVSSSPRELLHVSYWKYPYATYIQKPFWSGVHQVFPTTIISVTFRYSIVSSLRFTYWYTLLSLQFGFGVTVAEGAIWIRSMFREGGCTRAQAPPLSWLRGVFMGDAQSAQVQLVINK